MTDISSRLLKNRYRNTDKFLIAHPSARSL